MARALEVIVRANGWFMQDVRVWLVNARGPSDSLPLLFTLSYPFPSPIHL